jgi:RNA polymerase sigma-70 factor (ECF subfamily)
MIAANHAPPGLRISAMTNIDPPADLARLLARTALADRAAFQELYRACAPKLFAVALRIVHERALAEEVLQDSFVSIWGKARDYVPARGAPFAWMAAIVDDALATNLVDESAVPAQDVEGRAAAHALHQCLEELESEQRQTIALAFFHGLTHSELASHLRRPLGTVKTHVRRGLLRLKDCLGRAGMAEHG